MLIMIIIFILIPIIYAGSTKNIYALSTGLVNNINFMKTNFNKTECSLFFQDEIIRSIDTKKEKIKFIYTTQNINGEKSKESYLNAIQSLFLWGYTKVAIIIDDNQIKIKTDLGKQRFENSDVIIILADKNEVFDLLDSFMMNNNQNMFYSATETLSCPNDQSIKFKVFRKN